MHRHFNRSQNTSQSPQELTDCKYFSEGKCNSQPCNYRHNTEALKRGLCTKWEEGTCCDKNCMDRHPRSFWNTKKKNDKESSNENKKNKCFKYPDCPYGNQCKYWHPSSPTNSNPNKKSASMKRSNSHNIMCRDYPNCVYKDKCKFKHPDTTTSDNNNNNNSTTTIKSETNKGTAAFEKIVSATNLEDLAEACKDLDTDELQSELGSLTEKDLHIHQPDSKSNSNNIPKNIFTDLKKVWGKIKERLTDVKTLQSFYNMLKQVVPLMFPPSKAVFVVGDILVGAITKNPTTAKIAIKLLVYLVDKMLDWAEEHFSTSSPEEQGTVTDSIKEYLSKNKKFAFSLILLSGLGGGVGSVLMVPSLLALVGFTSTGVTGGSIAAAWMSAYGGSVASGSAFAVLQSIGAVGLGATGAVAVGVAGFAVVSAVTAFGVYQVLKKDDDKKDEKPNSNSNSN